MIWLASFPDSEAEGEKRAWLEIRPCGAPTLNVVPQSGAPACAVLYAGVSEVEAEAEGWKVKAAPRDAVHVATVAPAEQSEGVDHSRWRIFHEREWVLGTQLIRQKSVHLSKAPPPDVVAQRIPVNPPLEVRVIKTVAKIIKLSVQVPIIKPGGEALLAGEAIGIFPR